MIWKDVVGYEGLYKVSDTGIIRSEITGKVRKQSLQTNKRYFCIGLSKDGASRMHRTHRIVAMAFIDNPENKPEVNHISGDRMDNSVGNLEWVTRSENHVHKCRVLGTGLPPTMTGKFGFDHNRSKAVRVVYPSGREKVYGSYAEASRDIIGDNSLASHICYRLTKTESPKFKKGKLKGYEVYPHIEIKD